MKNRITVILVIAMNIFLMSNIVVADQFALSIIETQFRKVV